MGVFSISPVELTASGKKLLDNAETFKTNSENIFKTVDEMIHSDYISPEAMAIANQIYSYSDDLTRMCQTIARYGKFCITSSSKIEATQDDIISRVHF